MRRSFVPAVPTCFWCRKPKPLGLVTQWYEAAHDYLPCPDCDALFRRGVVVIEVTSEANVPGQVWLRPNMPGKFPTNRYFVMQRAVANLIGLPHEIITAGFLTASPAGYAEIWAKIEAEKRATTLKAFAQKQLLPLPEAMAQ